MKTGKNRRSPPSDLELSLVECRVRFDDYRCASPRTYTAPIASDSPARPVGYLSELVLTAMLGFIVSWMSCVS